MSELPATTTRKGIQEMATDAEALAGTDETRYINSKQAKSTYEQYNTKIQVLSASNNLKASSDTEVFASSWSWIKKQIAVWFKWTIRVKFDVSKTSWYSVQWQIYINWVAVWWTTWSWADYPTFTTHTFDVTVEHLDIVQLYVSVNNSYRKNFRIYYDSTFTQYPVVIA